MTIADHAATTPHDPSGPAVPGGHAFGVPCDPAHARVVIVPVPFDATCSYGLGTSLGPEAVRAASGQIDLHDRRFGDVFRIGIAMDPHDAEIAALNEEARALTAPIAAKGGATAADDRDIRHINAIGDEVQGRVERRVGAILDAGKVPFVLGGEHSVALGAITAAAARHPGLGVLQVDAHMDLRRAYLGFHHAHASVMLNAIEAVRLKSVVQVGIRDFAEAEERFAQARAVRVHHWDDLADALDAGTPWRSLCRDIIDPLPEKVYLSFDIDGLDPALCPNTGTPVPGGLSWDQASIMIDALRRSGRRVVGMDLVEVAPGPDGAAPIDEIVGARLMYRMCALAAPLRTD